jgi:hypothetical protein
MSFLTLNKKHVWVDKPAVMNNQSPPTQNEWVTIFEEYGGVKVFFVTLSQGNQASAAKAVEVRIFPNGQSDAGFGSSINDAGAEYFVIQQCTVSGWTLLLGSTSPAFFGRTQFGGSEKNMASSTWEGKSLKIQVRMTDAPGTNQYLITRVTYAKLESV